MKKVKCAWSGRVIKVSLDQRTGCYVGRCNCKRAHLAVVHPDTYNDSQPIVFAA